MKKKQNTVFISVLFTQSKDRCDPSHLSINRDMINKFGIYHGAPLSLRRKGSLVRFTTRTFHSVKGKSQQVLKLDAKRMDGLLEAGRRFEELVLNDSFPGEDEKSSGDGRWEWPSLSQDVLNKPELDSFDGPKWQILSNVFFFFFNHNLKKNKDAVKRGLSSMRTASERLAIDH